MLMFRNASQVARSLAITAFVACFAAPALARDDGTDLMEIDPKKFSRSMIIDNKWMPLKPGTQLIYEDTAVDEDGKRVPHKIVFTVTDLIKKIHGIDVVVVWDTDYSEGKLQESELTFFAQDDEGNVWHLGQYNETYDDVELVGGRAWMVGHLKDAKAGIMMKANPKEGTPSYSQGFAPPPFNWTDRAQTRKIGEKLSVPAGTFENVLINEEWAEAGTAIQLKYYAQDVGNIKVGFEGEDEKKEILELTKIVNLTPAEMDQVRAEALKLEDRNYVYGRTEPARLRP